MTIPKNNIILDCSDFGDWSCLNDSIMGGKSTAICSTSSDGLLIDGTVIEDGGGFISCRSSLLSPPLDLSTYDGLEVNVESPGLTLKLALSVNDQLTNLSSIVSSGLKWVTSFKTKNTGMTRVRIPFNDFQPTIRATPIRLPLNFNSSSIHRIQLLYSKFGVSEKFCSDFRSGPITILLRSISGFN